MSIQVLATANLTNVASEQADVQDNVIKRISSLTTHVYQGGDLRNPPDGWRATYHNDDPSNEPDLWVSDQEPAVWCKLDKHDPVVSNEVAQNCLELGMRVMCDWCGTPHNDTSFVFTFMLPEDY